MKTKFTLQQFRAAFLAFMGRDKIVAFANEKGDIDSVMVANEFKLGGDGWVQLSPFGDFDNAQGMQRIGPDEALNIVNEFNSLLNTPQRMMGLPWYIGHPDHPLFKDRYKDTRSYGRVKELQVRQDAGCQACKANGNPPCPEHGLFANVKWNGDGKKLIEDEAFHGHSVNWRLRKHGGVFKPFALKSVGFTNEPGIPVAPITAANENTMNKLMDYIRKLLGTAEGVELTDEGATEALTTHIANMQSNAEAQRGEYDKLKGEHDAVNGKLSTIQQLLTKKEEAMAANEKAAREALAKAGITIPDGSDVVVLMGNEFALIAEKAKRVSEVETAMANERKSHAAFLIDAAIQTGRITPAQQKETEAQFANEGTFQAAADALMSKPVNLKLISALDANRKAGEIKDRSSKIQEMVNERMTKIAEANGGDPNQYYDRAFAEIRKENEALFANMKTPEPATKA